MKNIHTASSKRTDEELAAPESANKTDIQSLVPIGLARDTICDWSRQDQQRDWKRELETLAQARLGQAKTAPVSNAPEIPFLVSASTAIFSTWVTIAMVGSIPKLFTVPNAPLSAENAATQGDALWSLLAMLVLFLAVPVAFLVASGAIISTLAGVIVALRKQVQKRVSRSINIISSTLHLPETTTYSVRAYAQEDEQMKIVMTRTAGDKIEEACWNVCPGEDIVSFVEDFAQILSLASQMTEAARIPYEQAVASCHEENQKAYNVLHEKQMQQEREQEARIEHVARVRFHVSLADTVNTLAREYDCSVQGQDSDDWHDEEVVTLRC